MAAKVRWQPRSLRWTTHLALGLNMARFKPLASIWAMELPVCELALL